MPPPEKRTSVSTVTDSNEERIITRELPGIEIMFKAQGKRKEGWLQSYAKDLKLAFKFSVVTMQDKWLEPWSAERRWEIWAGDAYAPGLTNNIQKQCWKKGYISMTHGGGATPVTQTNDVHYHKPFRAEVCAMQQAIIIEKTRNAGGGLNECTDEELIVIFATVAQDVGLHLGACNGYKQTGTTVALDGSEDHLIAIDAKEFWDRLGMRENIKKSCRGV